MKKQLQQKHKVMIGVGAGLLGTAAIATPLAIVLPKNDVVVEGNFDVQYGIDKTAYNKMKEQFTRNYAAKLEAEHIHGQEAAKAMANLNRTFVTLDTQVSKLTKSKTNNTYFAATSAMLTIARHTYGVDLERKSRANWNEVEDMFGSMLESFKTYMDNNHFDEKEAARVITDATTRKDAMMKELKTQYSNDVLGGVLKAKAQLLSFFDSVNDAIAKFAGMLRLNEFFKNYTILFRNDATTLAGIQDKNANRVDTLRASGELTQDNVIRKETMDKLFVIRNNETMQETAFDNGMIPGYTLTPTLKGFVDDGITNDHKILIDWSIVSNNAKDAEKATAHLLEADNEAIELAKKTDATSFDDFFSLADRKIKLMDYDVYSSDTNESNLLAATYFNKAANGTNIEFTWDTALGAKPCYDGFMYADQNTTDVQKLTLRQLSQTGVVIKCGSDARLLKDVIALVDQDNYEPKDMIEKFVKYCDVEDEIVINGDNVSNTLNAYYKNEKSWNTHGQKSIGSYVCSDTMMANGFEISEDFYTNVNNSYNLAYHHAYLFIDNKYKDVADEAESTNIANYVCASLQVALFAYLGFKSCIYAAQQRYGASTAAAVCAAIQAIILKFTMDAGTRFEDHYVKPVKDYKRRANQFYDNGETKRVKGLLDKDYDLFVVYDIDHPIDPVVFQQKMEKFRTTKNKEQQKTLFRLYSYFDIDPQAGQRFFENAYKLEINPQKFLEDFGDWDKYGEEFGICLSLTMASSTLIVVMKGIDDEIARENAAAQAAARQQAQLVEDAAFRAIPEAIRR